MLDLNWHLFRERYKFLKFLNFPKSCKQRNCTSFTRDGAEWSVAEGDGWRHSPAILRGKSYAMKWWPMACFHNVNFAKDLGKNGGKQKCHHIGVRLCQRNQLKNKPISFFHYLSISTEAPQKQDTLLPSDHESWYPECCVISEGWWTHVGPKISWN